MSTQKPKLIAFDLDKTLWPLVVGDSICGPFFKDEHGSVVNADNQIMPQFKESTKVLEKLYEEDFILAAVSRSLDPEASRQLLKLFKWEHYFTYIEIYNTSKAVHFKRIKELSKLEYKEMVIFDDDEMNFRDLHEIGVLMIKVKGEMTEELITKGLKEYSDNHAK